MTADPDNDGHNNLIEYALGTHPNDSTSRTLPVFQKNGNTATLTYPRLRGNLTYTVQHSADLIHWSTIGIDQDPATPPGQPATATLPVAPDTENPSSASGSPIPELLTCLREKLKDSLCIPGLRVLVPRAMFSHTPIEWPDKVETLLECLEDEATERALSREERAILDIVETVPFLEGEDGLHGFWHAGLNHQRIIRSFELVGASTIADALTASQWCESRGDDRHDYSETEEDYLQQIEEELDGGMEELVDLVLEFIEDELE